MAAELRVGVIKKVLADKDRCIVHFDEDDELDSYELCVLHCNSLKNRHYHLPDVDEQVYVLTDENGEEGVILGAIYSEADPPPLSAENKYYMDFEDGTSFEYDRKEHKLKLKVSSSGTIEIECEGNISVRTDKALELDAKQRISLTAPEIALNTAALTCSAPESSIGACNATIKGNVDIQGQTMKINSSSASLTAVQTTLNGPLSANGNVSVSGNVFAIGSILDMGGNSNHHAHG